MNIRKWSVPAMPQPKIHSAMEPETWVLDPTLVQESRRPRNCYQALANDLRIDFADAGKWGVGPAFDGVHFSKAGHRVLAGGMLRVLKALNEK